MRIDAAGDRALLVTLPGVSSAELRAAADAARAVAGVVAAIVGHESVYVIGTADAEAMRRAIDSRRVAGGQSPAHHSIVISVRDECALDLPAFLAHAGVSRHDFARRLPSIPLSVRYLGFRAGFAYIDGWPKEWAMPRRATSRNRVHGGSFGIAGTMAGFYAVESPGGWNLLGRTAAALWDPLREPPNLFAPGDSIDIHPTGEAVSVAAGVPARRNPEGNPVAEVISPGQLTTIVGSCDWSRLEHGLPAGGPFDEPAMAAANEAVGNDRDAPLLECVLVGPKLKSTRRAAFCDGDLNVRAFPAGEIEIGRIRGMRGYLAIEGGIDEMRLRYSERPAVIRRGDVLAGLRSSKFEVRMKKEERRSNFELRTSPKTIRVIHGPHDAPPLPESWEVTPQLDRVGIRFKALQPSTVKPPADLPSLGAQFGTLQWHADGSLVALGPDHPVTGGYLQPATVIAADLWKLGQLAPGDRVVILSRPSTSLRMTRQSPYT